MKSHMFLKDSDKNYKRTHYHSKMSQLRKSNRDKAFYIFDKLKNKEEECSMINMKDILLKILQKVPVKQFSQIKQTNEAWETVAFIGGAATLADLWDVPVRAIRDYMPTNETERRKFQYDWQHCHTLDNYLKVMNDIQTNV